MKRIVFPILLIAVTLGLGCASFSRNALNTLNASRDLYNFSAATAVENQCPRDADNKEIDNGICITYAKWVGQIRPGLKKWHDTTDSGYAELKTYNHAKTVENKTTVQAILDQLPDLMKAVKELIGIQ